MDPVDVIIWIFVSVFLLTAIVTLGGIVDNFRFIQVADKYLKGLYVALLLEVVGASVAVATGVLNKRAGEELLGEPASVHEGATVDSVIAAGALIVDCHNEKPAMLGVLHDENELIVFSPPAGRSNVNESAMETAVRETAEETGYSVIADRVLGRAPMGNPNFSMVLAKMDRTRQASPHFQEVVGLLWTNPADIPARSWRFPNQREWIVELFEENAPSQCD